MDKNMMQLMSAVEIRSVLLSNFLKYLSLCINL